ncbi:MAG TPA: tRNA uracil 4-sulfurtransferase ThiI [Nitrososphaerales archaeon]|nr:tRNA uracil 4-sulfurtransferase ThiI [Nitrososphaerales archaeon]
MTMLFVVHYSEVTLKGNNRPEFIRALRKNINRALSGIDHQTAFSEGRFIVNTTGGEEEVRRRLSTVFGVSWFAPVSVVSQDYEEILEEVLRLARSAKARTFKISPRRADKGFPTTSQELAARLGAEVVRSTAMPVDLSAPDLTIHVDVVRGKALIYTAKYHGPGGLPLGTAGRAIHLFSGGIDSPVAAWLMMKRGTRPVYLHFYLAPTPQAAVESKITGLVRVLSAYAGKSTLVLVPFADYQLATTAVPGELEPSLFRRFMRMTAEALASRFGASAISTGDSLSQAASQTLWNIASFDQGSSLPILRPLLTFDKDEIVSLGRRIGTYDLSLEEYKDCCAIITRHPRTRVKGALVTEYVGKLGLQELVWTSVEKATLVTYNPVGNVLKASPLAESALGARAA